MRAVVRSSVTAGVALMGAATIAVTPVQPQATEMPLQYTAVQLSAIPSPLQLYPQVFLQSLSNAGALLEQYFADPFPILSAIAENQAAAFADAVLALESGRFDDFVAAATDIVLEPLRGTSAAFVHLGALLSQPFAVEGFFLIAISPVVAGIVATGQAVSEVFDALTSLDLIGAVNAFINIPARIIDGVLNGVPDASFGILSSLPGLLSPLEDGAPGPIAVGINLDQDMGAAIPPYESTTAIDEIPDPDAATVMLSADVVSTDESGIDATDDDGTADTADDTGDTDGAGDTDQEVAEPDTDDTDDLDAGPDSSDAGHDNDSGADAKPGKVRSGAAAQASDDDAGAGEAAA